MFATGSQCERSSFLAFTNQLHCLEPLVGRAPPRWVQRPNFVPAEMPQALPFVVCCYELHGHNMPCTEGALSMHQRNQRYGRRLNPDWQARGQLFRRASLDVKLLPLAVSPACTQHSLCRVKWHHTQPPSSSGRQDRSRAELVRQCSAPRGSSVAFFRSMVTLVAFVQSVWRARARVCISVCVFVAVCGWVVCACSVLVVWLLAK